MSVLSDRDIRAALESGEIVVKPYDQKDLQPSSVDLHLDRRFRVFRNNRYPYIDVRHPQPDLTELPNDLLARLEGKALAVDTPIPTPVGWRTMGELEPGDAVFDERGMPTTVVAATLPMTNRPCREVLFSDGSYVVSDAEHQWVTVDKNGRRYGRARLEV